MKEVLYSVLKQNARIYEIMLLHDQQEKTFIDIAKQYEISSARIRDLYLKGKIKPRKNDTTHYVNRPNNFYFFQKIQ